MADQPQFELLAERTLEALAEAIENAGADADADVDVDVDVELEDGVLTVEMADGRIFLLNRHVPLRQLWLSSPVSGASHYAHDAAAGGWRSTRDGSDLLERLRDEFRQVAGVNLNLA